MTIATAPAAAPALGGLAAAGAERGMPARGLGEMVHSFPFDADFDTQLRDLGARFDGYGTIAWIDEKAAEHVGPADSRLLDAQLYRAVRIRDTSAYPGRRAYQGNYYCASTGAHVWHESLLEGRRVASLDAAGDLQAIAAQPMRIRFADGAQHFPDYLALHDTGRQVLYDVKPARRIRTERFLAQAARTLALCRRVGWGFAVLTDLPAQAEDNFGYLTAHHHPDLRPDAAAVDRLAAACADGPVTIEAAAAIVRPDRPAAGLPGVLHLLWHGELATDLTAGPLTSATPIGWSRP